MLSFSDGRKESLSAFAGRINLIYWHSGCPSSVAWLPELYRLAKSFDSSLNMFVVTNQTSNDLVQYAKAPQFFICEGNVRKKEPRFKHYGSSHMVILDKNLNLRAYGYRLTHSDSIITALVNENPFTKTISKAIKKRENLFQRKLANHENFGFSVSGYNRNFKGWSASHSITKVDIIKLILNF